MLSSAGSLLVTRSAARQPGPTSEIQLSAGSSGAYPGNILQCTSMPNSPANATKSALYLHAFISNDAANSAAIFTPYLCLYGIAMVVFLFCIIL